MSDPKHGDYDPAKGWYSSLTRAWYTDPKKIGTVTPRREPTEFERQEFAQSKWANNGKARFEPVPMFESLIRLRESDKPEDRQKFEQIVAGTTRGQLHYYEASKAKASKDGAA